MINKRLIILTIKITKMKLKVCRIDKCWNNRVLYTLNRIALFFILLAVQMVYIACNRTHTTDISTELTGVSPTPQIEHYANKLFVLSEIETTIPVFLENLKLDESAPLDNGLTLFSKRLEYLGGGKLTFLESQKKAKIIITRCSEKEMEELLKKQGVKEKIEGKRLAQSYYLTTENHGFKSRVISIQASGDLGLYYGLVSLCQLVDKHESNAILLPETTILDWPEIGLRLTKTSASGNTISVLEGFADWMPVYKFNMIGLQFHGEESKELGLFEENIETMCPREKQKGLLETIVYYCPFRGEGYNFTKETDQNEYKEILSWILKLGADGIEVDYNDWPGGEAPIEDVLNLAHDKIQLENPEAYILYCPPYSGSTKYFGEASAETRRILSHVPQKIWPLWTGMGVLILDTLKSQQVEQWTEMAGRRPFFWINRASVEVEHSFSHSLPNDPDALVFSGELLPENLYELFEGVHLNFPFGPSPNGMDPINDFNKKDLLYLATASDFLWNPKDWMAEKSYNKAKHFLEVFLPLI